MLTYWVCSVDRLGVMCWQVGCARLTDWVCYVDRLGMLCLQVGLLC